MGLGHFWVGDGVGEVVSCSLGWSLPRCSHSWSTRIPFVKSGHFRCVHGVGEIVLHSLGKVTSIPFTQLSHSQFIHSIGPRRSIYIPIPALLIYLPSLFLSRSPGVFSPSANVWPLFQELKHCNILPCSCSQSSRTEVYETLYIVPVLLTVIVGIQMLTVFFAFDAGHHECLL